MAVAHRPSPPRSADAARCVAGPASPAASARCRDAGQRFERTCRPIACYAINACYSINAYHAINACRAINAYHAYHAIAAYRAIDLYHDIAPCRNVATALRPARLTRFPFWLYSCKILLARNILSGACGPLFAYTLPTQRAAFDQHRTQAYFGLQPASLPTFRLNLP